jgi:hypothetical protein
MIDEYHTNQNWTTTTTTTPQSQTSWVRVYESSLLFTSTFILF